MTAEIDNLVLEHLRAIRTLLTQHGERLDRIDLRLAVIEQYQALLHTDFAALSVHVNRIGTRCERIELSLGLSVETPPPGL